MDNVEEINIINTTRYNSIYSQKLKILKLKTNNKLKKVKLENVEIVEIKEDEELNKQKELFSRKQFSELFKNVKEIYLKNIQCPEFVADKVEKLKLSGHVKDSYMIQQQPKISLNVIATSGSLKEISLSYLKDSYFKLVISSEREIHLKG